MKDNNKKNYVTINVANITAGALEDINLVELHVRALEKATKKYTDEVKKWNKAHPYTGRDEDKEAKKRHNEARRRAVEVYKNERDKEDKILRDTINNFYVRYSTNRIDEVLIDVEAILRNTGIMTGHDIDNKARKRIEAYMNEVRKFNEARKNESLISEDKAHTYRLYFTKQKIDTRKEALILFSFFFACGISYNDKERFHVRASWAKNPKVVIATANGLPEEEATAPTKPEEATATA